MKREEVMQIRELLGMDQHAFARLLCVDQRTVRRWEEGVASPGGTAEGVLAALREVGMNASLPQLRQLIAQANPIGGISYVLVKLLRERGAPHV